MRGRDVGHRYPHEVITGSVGTVISARLRRRRAALAGVVLLTAVVAGTGLAATATARRAASSLTRALEDAAVADISIDVSNDQHLAEVAALPEVEAASTLAFVAEVRNIERVRSYPRALATFFAVLGVGSVAHLCVTAARRGRRDLAVAKALGFTRRQVRAVLAWQATIVIVVGLVAGIPLGLAAGRITWSAVTARPGHVRRGCRRALGPRRDRTRRRRRNQCPRLRPRLARRPPLARARAAG